jgi:lipid-A-disaccharide synthase
MAKFMIIAGEASGDTLGAELVKALRRIPKCERAEFFGAGGPKLKAAGVDVAIEMTKDAVIGVSDAIAKGFLFLRRMQFLKRLAMERKPDVVILVDFSFFNHKFARALRKAGNADWRPKIVKYVSPQVWASRPGRAYDMPRDFDLLLSIFPFEKAWYAERVPEFRVEFVGHPMIERYAGRNFSRSAEKEILLLPGSRTRELRQHLPAMVEAVKLMRKCEAFRCRMVLPTNELKKLAATLAALEGIEVEVEDLPERLSQATVAIASSGTVTMECAFFRVPTVVLYKTSWSTYALGRRIIKVKYLAMPNLLAGKEIYPEFIQNEATGPNLANAALALLRDDLKRTAIQKELDAVIASLGEKGAADRAARHVADLITC